MRKGICIILILSGIIGIFVSIKYCTPIYVFIYAIILCALETYDYIKLNKEKENGSKD